MDGTIIQYHAGWLTTYAKGLPNSVCRIKECGLIPTRTFMYCADNLGSAVINPAKFTLAPDIAGMEYPNSYQQNPNIRIPKVSNCTTLRYIYFTNHAFFSESYYINTLLSSFLLQPIAGYWHLAESQSFKRVAQIMFFPLSIW